MRLLHEETCSAKLSRRSKEDDITAMNKGKAVTSVWSCPPRPWMAVPHHRRQQLAVHAARGPSSPLPWRHCLEEHRFQPNVQATQELNSILINEQLPPHQAPVPAYLVNKTSLHLQSVLHAENICSILHLTQIEVQDQILERCCACLDGQILPHVIFQAPPRFHQDLHKCCSTFLLVT